MNKKQEEGKALIGIGFSIWVIAAVVVAVVGGTADNSQVVIFALVMGVIFFIVGFVIMLIGVKKTNEFSKLEQLQSSHNAEATTKTPSPVSLEPTLSNINLTDELQKAAKMFEDGLIDEEEYKALKKKLIEKS